MDERRSSESHSENEDVEMTDLLPKQTHEVVHNNDNHDTHRIKNSASAYHYPMMIRISHMKGPLVFAFVPLFLLGMGILLSQKHRIPSETEFENAKMCSPTTGECFETPYLPSPRTIYSSWTRDQYLSWYSMHKSLVSRAKVVEADSSYSVKEDRLPPLMLIGDSITEAWAGTKMGIPSDKFIDEPTALAYLSALLDGKYHSNILVNGISGDQTQHVLYRLNHGELPKNVAHHKKATFVVLIGTNNLGSGHLPSPTSLGIIAVVEYLLNHTNGRVLLMKLLPRGDGKKKLPKLCPPRCGNDGNPFTSFIPAIDKVNDALEEEKSESLSLIVGNAYKDGRLRLKDCGGIFKANGEDEEVKQELLPDLLHPNGEGMKEMARCISKELLIEDWTTG
mmetsp:Transcript_37912/g.55887  ORF Transcript_37912/g.55887 Transcript_37912/m.55887 type:complete len:393 (+) Transcript_37912:61-1239(+)|eukprot:CAMPEP_0195509890 /NCGR_PEP_ID=MMETSP0794_2-20130614/2694_1 /TAXON_ID=515487 /ORGANISM="Stephanopyxis turris, Strain CCMP 815" /LENGTH=392 /DNA_ID=CAMNT_0040637209 /DNA_START=60 /DNA_END=1238 /DNA_ORIENTATION=-